MKLLVTGANGLLGQKLIRLSESLQEISFVATGKGLNRNPPGRYEYRQLDVTLQDEVSSIDLARALIESGEKDKAKEILITIIKTGSPDDAHEARILNLQIS